MPNHHAHHRAFSGLFGLFAGLTMIRGRDGSPRLAADTTGVRPGDHLVDIGCGPGAAAREAASRGARVTAVDPAPVMLTLGRWLTRSRLGVEWVEAAAESLPLPDASATVLWALATVHHWHDVDTGLAEAHRVLTPGGRMVAIERQTHTNAQGLASHGWTDEQANAFADCCRAAGFRDVHVETKTADRKKLLVVSAIS